VELIISKPLGYRLITGPDQGRRARCPLSILVLAGWYDDAQLTEGQGLGRKERHNCSVIGTPQKRKMAVRE
jgi:hypothetical protein